MLDNDGDDTNSLRQRRPSQQQAKLHASTPSAASTQDDGGAMTSPPEASPVDPVIRTDARTSFSSPRTMRRAPSLNVSDDSTIPETRHSRARMGRKGIMARSDFLNGHDGLPRWLQRWRRRCFDAVLLWETLMRGVFVVMPTFVFDQIDGLNKLVTVFFAYVMLQALAILWAFLFNIAAIVADNMIKILQMPYVQALCVLLTHAAAIGIVLSFGRAMWILTWQSTQNFPMIRRIIAYECRPQSVILVGALPMLALLPTLILVPTACGQFLTTEQVVGPATWGKTLCEDSYLKFITDRHPIFQRALRLSTAIAIWQFVQLGLEILPRWRSALSNMSAFSTFVLAGFLFVQNVLGFFWFTEWIARHFKYSISPLSGLTPVQWEIFGMALLTAWILWFLHLTWQTSYSVHPTEANQKQLIGLFQRLKCTFVVGQAIVFVRACVHPDMGFVHAQLELTIINLLLPSIYVVSLVVLRMVSLLSLRTLTISAPLSIALASAIFLGSKMTERPHCLFVLSIFLFEMSLRWSDAVSSLHGMGRVPVLLQEMLRSTTSATRRPPTGHGTARQIVYLASFVLFLYVSVIAGFSVLSVLQQNTKWYPDATSVTFHNDSSIEIHHTAIVKLHLDLANSSSESMHVPYPRYASCGNKWNGLSLIDFALFAEAAYFDPVSKDAAVFISTMFTGDLSGIQIRYPALNSKTGSKLDFFEAYIPALNTSVISVRGTDVWRFTDFIEDVKMFAEPVIFTILSGIFPTIRIWPDVTFSTLIELYSELISLFGLHHDFWYYHELLEYVQSIQDREVVLTGHSMGGGIAKLVGSIVGKTSITFSPPGFVQSYSKLVHDIGGKALKVDRNSLHHRSVAVVPEYDPITLIDAQAGMIQKISCNTPHLSMQLSCHMLEGTLCNLLENCGDNSHRISACRFEHKITGITDDLVLKLAAFLHPEMVMTVAMVVSILLSVFVHNRRRPTLQTQFLAHGPSSKGKPPSPASRRELRNAREKRASSHSTSPPPRRKSTA